MEPSVRSSLVARFQAQVPDYATSRPGYPAAAVEWAVGSRPVDVLDLAAGTGALTSRLVAAGHRVAAVDFSLPMLVELTSRLPDVSWPRPAPRHPRSPGRR